MTMRIGNDPGRMVIFSFPFTIFWKIWPLFFCFNWFFYLLFLVSGRYTQNLESSGEFVRIKKKLIILRSLPLK